SRLKRIKKRIREHCKEPLRYYVQAVPNHSKQLGLTFRTRGGKRHGAGRKMQGARPRVSHKTRPVLRRRFPVHVTVRMREGVSGLRSKSCFSALKNAFNAANARSGLGLDVRMALALNRLMRRRGKVFADRCHAVVLKTPTQTKRALHYVVHNRQHHAPGRYAVDWRDPFASAEAPLVAPRTWLLASSGSDGRRLVR